MWCGGIWSVGLRSLAAAVRDWNEQVRQYKAKQDAEQKAKAEKLEPCPKCGKQPSLQSSRVGRYRYGCDTCPTGAAGADSAVVAMFGWNLWANAAAEQKAKEEPKPDIAPCPWCPGTTNAWCARGSEDEPAHVYCPGCDARGPDGTDEREAIAGWNMVARQQQRIRELEATIERQKDQTRFTQARASKHARKVDTLRNAAGTARDTLNAVLDEDS